MNMLTEKKGISEHERVRKSNKKRKENWAMTEDGIKR